MPAMLEPRRLLVVSPLLALAVIASTVPPARADVAVEGLPQPKVELNVSASMLSDLFGVTDAALAGVVEALQGHESHGEAVPLTAQQLAAAKNVLSLATESVHGVRVRVYEGIDPEVASSVVTRLESSLDSEGWERVVSVNDGNERVRIALRNEEGSVRGARIVVLDGDNVVTLNADCDVSPERAQELSRTVTAIALDLGLEQAIEKAVQEVRSKVHAGH